MELGIQGLRVLVTAGAGGIGLEIARSFVREGARVHLCDVDEAALGSLATSDPDVAWSRADVANRADVTQLFEEALDTLGGLDVLVSNAGIAGPTARVDEISPEDWDRTLEVNITGQFNCARLAVPICARATTRPSSISRRLQDVWAFPYAHRIPLQSGRWWASRRPLPWNWGRLESGSTLFFQASSKATGSAA